MEVEEVDDGLVFDDGEVRITVVPTDHRPVHPTVGYRINAGGRSKRQASISNAADGRLTPIHQPIQLEGNAGWILPLEL